MALSYALSAFGLRKVSIIKSKQLSTKCRYNVMVLLCTAETERDKAWWEHWLVLTLNLLKVWFKVYHVDLTHLSSISRTKFFVTTVNSWESLIVDTKIPILVTLGVLDSPLCEIKMSKLNKQHISETSYY